MKEIDKVDRIFKKQTIICLDYNAAINRLMSL